MIIDKTLIQEYPFFGRIYSYTIDESVSPLERVEEEVLVLETECDIQESTKTDTWGNNVVSYNVYFPFNIEDGVNIKRGMVFKGSFYGIDVEGEIMGLFPTQLGGCAIYLKDRKV